MTATADTYQDKANEWRWRVKAANGEIVAVGESYTTEADAKRGLVDAGRNFAEALDAVAIAVEGGDCEAPYCIESGLCTAPCELRTAP